MKIVKICFLVCAAFLIALPALFTNFQPDEISEFDNSKLPDFPYTSFRSDFNSYLSKRIGGRAFFITAYQRITQYAFDELAHPLYMNGKNGQIYDDWDLSDYQNLPVDMDYVRSLGEYLKSTQELSEAFDAKFYFLYVPNKETVYYEDFPDGYTVFDAQDRSDCLVNELNRIGVNCVDLRQSFLSHRNDTLLFNKKYDSGHWNSNGALFANKEFINNYLSADYPSMGVLQNDEFTYSTVLQPYLMNSRFPINEETPCYTLREDPMTEDTEAFFQEIAVNKNEYHHHYYREKSSDMPRILIIGDSYFGSYECEKYYKNHCSELMMVHSANLDQLPYYLSFYRPDIVILEAVERVIQQGAFSPAKISEPFYTPECFTDSYAEQICAGIKNEAYSHNGEYVTVAGAVPDEDIHAMAASVNGQWYYASIDRQSGTFQFRFQSEDYSSGSDLQYYCIKNPA